MPVGQAWGEPERVQRYIDDFQARQVDGMICFSHSYPDGGRVIEQMFAGLDNVVFVWPPSEPMRSLSSYATIDHAAGLARLVYHLHQQGRQRIALLVGDPRWESNAGRIRGYRQAHEELEVSLDESLIQVASEDITAEQVLHPMIDRCLDAGVDAILAGNDIVAMKVIRRLRLVHQRQIPGDVAVAGFDNTQASALFIPSLTTVDMDIRHWANVTVELLLERIESNGQAQPRQVVLQPNLVIRESTDA